MMKWLWKCSTYRLYHEVEVSTRFTHRGPKARGCVTHVETDTKWYNRLIPWWLPWQPLYQSAMDKLNAALDTLSNVLSYYKRAYHSNRPHIFVLVTGRFISLSSHGGRTRLSSPSTLTTWPFNYVRPLPASFYACFAVATPFVVTAHPTSRACCCHAPMYNSCISILCILWLCCFYVCYYN